MLAATMFHADLGRVILWGMLVGVPTAALAGPVVGWVLIPRWERRQAKLAASGMAEPAPAIEPAPENSEVLIAAVPAAGAVRALVAILLPISLIFVGSWADQVTVAGGIPNQIMHMLGYPDVALLIAVLVALVTLGGRIPREAHHGPDMLRKVTADSFVPIAGVLVILSAAGGLSGVLRDSGAAQATVGLAMGAHMPPLVLAWALAAVVRVCMGSSTVAMAVASGVLAPVAGQHGRSTRDAGSRHRMRVAAALARERLGILAGWNAVQAGREGNVGHLVGRGNCDFSERAGRLRCCWQSMLH